MYLLVTLFIHLFLGSYPKDEKVKGQEKLGKCLVSAKRIPYIHRAMAITSDPKGKNFAVIQVIKNLSYFLNKLFTLIWKFNKLKIKKNYTSFKKNNNL